MNAYNPEPGDIIEILGDVRLVVSHNGKCYQVIFCGYPYMAQSGEMATVQESLNITGESYRDVYRGNIKTALKQFATEVRNGRE